MDRFSWSPLAMICGNKRDDKVLKLMKHYNSHHGVPRKNFMDPFSSFTSKAVNAFCNSEGIEILYSPVNDHWATGCVERTIGSLTNFVLTYAKEKYHGNLESMVERALSDFTWYTQNNAFRSTSWLGGKYSSPKSYIKTVATKPHLGESVETKVCMFRF